MKLFDRRNAMPNVKIGILSDIHITTPESTDTLKHAFEYFREKRVDGVLIAGDMADHGQDSELQAVADAWFSVFPEDKYPDGKKVEKLFIYGNHDIFDEKWAHERFPELDNVGIRFHREQSWEDIFHEKYEPIYLKTINGYHFVGAHWCNYKTQEGVAEFLGAHHSMLRGEKPFFYFQHAHLRNTCNGPWAWGQDNGTVTDILSHYPNAVAFSGHSHSPLGEEWDLWQGTFTSIGTSSLNYIYPIGGRENTRVDGGPTEKSEMPRINVHDGRQGMLMSVYDDRIVIEKREFVYDESLGEDWVIPIGKLGEMSYENRAKNARIPQFKETDKVSVVRAMGKDRQGDEHMQITVSFPIVLAKTHGLRAFDYEVQVEARYIDVVKTDVTKRVFSSKYFLGEGHDTEDVKCVFAEAELPLNHEYRFAVRPCECFGGKGEPIFSEWHKPEYGIKQ